MKKIIFIIFVTIFLIGTISAMSPYEQERFNSMANIFSKIQYGSAKGLFLFTSWGQANGCSVSPTDAKYGYWEGWIKEGQSISCAQAGASKCAIDVWYDNTIYLGSSKPTSVNWNNWLGEYTTGSFSGTSNVHKWYYIEIYACPLNPVNPPAHNTQVYVCQNNVWANGGSFSPTQSCSYDPTGHCYCTSSTDNLYKDESGGVHCASSPNSAWCQSGGGGSAGGSSETKDYTATQLSLTPQDLDEATANTIMSATCSVNANCLPYVPLTGNQTYSVSCKSTAITKQKITDASKEVCKGYSLFSFKFLAGSTAAICAGALAITIVTAGGATPVTATICATAIAGSVAVGSTQVALESGCEIFKQKGAQGLCIAEQTGGTCDFFRSFSWFGITNDKCTDGMIIFFGGIALILFLIAMMGGRK